MVSVPMCALTEGRGRDERVDARVPRWHARGDDTRAPHVKLLVCDETERETEVLYAPESYAPERPRPSEVCEPIALGDELPRVVTACMPCCTCADVRVRSVASCIPVVQV